MHCVFSVSVRNAGLPSLYYALGVRCDADMFLSARSEGDGVVAMPTQDETGRSVIGIAPVRDLIVRADTDRNQIMDFCFDQPRSVLPATLGYLSYSYGLARYRIDSNKHCDLPLGHLRQYAVQLHVVPCAEGTGRSVVSCFVAELGAGATSAANADDVLRTLEVLCRQCDAGALHVPAYKPPLAPEELGQRLRQSLSASTYAEGVRRVLEHIRDGNTYQLNLSIRFDAALHDTRFDPLVLFMHLVQHNPAPFYAWFTSESRRIISTSPERFLRVRDGAVLTQPIKGTLAFDTYTAGMEHALTDSAKESAELSMIVDLIRNDISTHCEYGSVHVPRHKAVFAVDSLLQMYSDVCGSLRSDATCLDLLLDAFPGGSITGCPKRRTMRIIESLEPHCRDLYCGSMVCIEDPRNMDSSIAIRTGWYDIRTATLCFFAGSGIVIDSSPDREYDETLAKAGKFLRALVR